MEPVERGDSLELVDGGYFTPDLMRVPNFRSSSTVSINHLANLALSFLLLSILLMRPIVLGVSSYWYQLAMGTLTVREPKAADVSYQGGVAYHLLMLLVASLLPSSSPLL